VVRREIGDHCRIRDLSFSRSGLKNCRDGDDRLGELQKGMDHVSWALMRDRDGDGL
jgi:hypothetical protein